MIIFWLGLSQHSRAADWPQWRCDANRSAATDDPGPQTPGLLWSVALDRPDPAYDHQYRMCADAAGAPVAAGGLAFVPSNVTDQLAAYDLATGRPRWHFFAEGPVRFAPVCTNGRVVFGSDDGRLYCLDAASGRLLWKMRGAPDSLPDSRLLVNGRLCSRWPVRGGPVESGGVVYFGAGIWPEEGVYVCAVEAATGRLLWRTDALSLIKNGMCDHGAQFDTGLPPQGYLAMIDGKLAVPSGRTLAAWLDPAGGAPEPYTCYYVKTNPPRGTWNVMGIGRFCVQGGNWFGTRPDALAPVPPKLAAASTGIFLPRTVLENERQAAERRPFFYTDTYRLHLENLYSEPVLTPTTEYVSEFADDKKYIIERGHTAVAWPAFDRIVARDLQHPRWVRAVGKSESSDAPLRKMEFPIVWELASPLRVLIKAGGRLYAGGAGTIAAIAIPGSGEQPRVCWQEKVDGVPVNALAADGRLVVSTNTGRIYCFGEKGGAGGAVPEIEIKSTGGNAGATKGYALVLGWGDGKRAIELGRTRGTRVVVLEPDATAAAAARETLAGMGLYGARVQVIQGGPDTLSITPYWAGRVVMNAPAPEAACRLALDALHPYGGELHAPERAAETLKRCLAPPDELVTINGEACVRRAGGLPGAGDWTHEAAGPENTWAGADTLVKPPLGLLWYSGDVDRYFTPMMDLQAAGFQHTRNPYPLVAHGRMFLIACNLLHAIDIYNGNHLWKAEMPETPQVKARFDDSRVYGRPTERNYVAADDLVYAIFEREIRAYDAATGKEKILIPLPQEVAGDPKAIWTEVRLWGDTLLGVAGRTMLALDRHSGKVLWTRASTREATTYALGDGRVFGIDYTLTDDAKPAALAECELFALAAESGKPLWSRGVSYSPVANTPRIPKPWLLPIIPLLSYNAKHQLLVMTANRNGVQVFKGGDGSPAWANAIPQRPGDIQGIYEPVVTDDHLLIWEGGGIGYYLYDIQTGKKAGENTGINRMRGCGRPVGNSSLLTYRDGATEMYDLAANRMLEFNSVRAGCTASFIPAGGVIAAPQLGHGCVCNYPMFTSLGMVHMPLADTFRPQAVKDAWTNKFTITEPAPPGERPARKGRVKKPRAKK